MWPMTFDKMVEPVPDIVNFLYYDDQIEIDLNVLLTLPHPTPEILNESRPNCNLNLNTQIKKFEY